MDGIEQEQLTHYKVVVNEEEQYSIWPADRPNAPGWRDEGPSGSKAECLAYIREVWTDMRPLSLRKRMDALPKAPSSDEMSPEPGERGSDSGPRVLAADGTS